MAVDESILDVLIVGSGPAGVAAALACAKQGVKPTIVDVGNQPSETKSVDENFYDYASAHEVSDVLLGEDYSGLYNINPNNMHVSLPLALPKTSFVRRDADRLLPLRQTGFSAVQSLARGGLANAWGCAAYRYDDHDLASFPISASDLETHYDTLTKEIGINGADDDLTRFYGSARHLQPPLKLGINSSMILANYERRRKRLNLKGVYAGRMRLAVLTEDHGDRLAHPYHNTDMYCRLSAFYSPAYTLDRLVDQDRTRYVSRTLVERWSKKGSLIRVEGMHVDTGDRASFLCRRLILAAGAINSSRIVLRSFEDYSTTLPLLDNPAVYVPCFLFRRIGKRLDTKGYGFATLACVFDFEEYSTHLHGLLFELMNTPRAELYRHMPCNASFNALLVKQMMPAMMVMLLYFPSDALRPGRLQLRPSGELDLRGPENLVQKDIVKRALRSIKPMGLAGFASLAEMVPYGASIHYAGSLPMMKCPSSRYHTAADGSLAGEQDVFIVDGAAFPSLSSKNHTLTIMANAMRVTTCLCRKLHDQIT